MASSLNRPVKIIGAALSLGQTKYGVNYTPHLLKIEKIKQLSEPYAVWGDIVEESVYRPEEPRINKVRNLKEIGQYNRALYSSILKNTKPEEFLLTIGGNHSIASSTVSALLSIHKSNLGVIWVDAHGDCNTPDTSITGNYHGMPLAHVLGLFRDPQHLNWGQLELDLGSVAMIGLRDIDPKEKELMDSIGLVYFTMDQVKSQGIQTIMQKALKHVDPDNSKMMHLSLDVDGLDPSIFPGTGTKVPDGISLEQYKVIADSLKNCGQRFCSMDLVELNFGLEKKITMQSTIEVLRMTLPKNS